MKFEKEISKMVWDKIKDVAKNSNCKKRNVGCIIVTEDGQLVAAGYNWHEDGVCDCATNKTALHAEIMAVNNIPVHMREENLYAYITHKPCDRCESILRKICTNVEWKDVSPVLPGWKEADLLDERKNTHGKFRDSSKFVQKVKADMAYTPNWPDITPSRKEALHMIQHKIGRILYGQADFSDSWVDIAGYATLIVKELDNDKT